MARTITAAGTGSSTSSGSTLAFNCGASFAINDTMVIVVSADNAGSAGSVTNITTCTDAIGNTYVKQINDIYDNGAASAGAEIAIFVARIVAAMLTTDQVTIHFNNNTTSKCAVVWKITGGQTRIVGGAAGVGATTGAPTVTTTSIPSGDFVFAGYAGESNAAVTADADTSNGSWSSQATAVADTGTVTTSMRVASQAKTATGAGTQTYNPTMTSCDNILGWVQLTEAADPVASVVYGFSRVARNRAATR